MSDFDFDAALQATVDKQRAAAGDTPPEATDDAIVEKYGAPDDPENPNVVPVDAPTGDAPAGDEIVEEELTEEELEALEDEDQPKAQVDDEDPIVKEYLDKFGGDLAKAIKSAAHQTSKIGEQGKELGELRSAITQMQSMLLDQQQRQNAPVDQVYAASQFEDQIEEDPAAVAHWAFQNGQEAVYDEAMRAWAQEDPLSAGRFERAIEMEALRVEFEQRQQAPASDSNSVIAGLQAKHPDFSEVVASATPEELEGLDRNIVALVEQTNPTAAFEMVYNHIKVKRPASATGAPQDEADAAKREAADAATRTAKRDAAAVARGTSRPAPGDTSTMDRLKESMLSPDPFNVQQGLREAG